MDYIELDCTILPKEKGLDVVIAALSEIGFESFEETESGVKAYIQAGEYVENSIEDVPYLKTNDFFELKYSRKLIPEQNWNAVWERNFEPVQIENVSIRAPFHPKVEGMRYEITIEPKMSFGTGHHETTGLMVAEMLLLNFENKTVLDMGCGTGILAILAAQMGAKKVTAIDNDSWAYTNTLENIARNNTPDIEVVCGTFDKLKGCTYDTILANINRNILLKDLQHYCQQLSTGGVLLMSGFLDVDLPVMSAACKSMQLTCIDSKSNNHWALLKCGKE